MFGEGQAYKGSKRMDFAWSSEQRELMQAVAAFASKHLNESVIEHDRKAEFNREAWRHCGQFGIQGLCVPTGYGGLGLDPLTAVGVLEQLGYACKDNGLIFSLNAHMWAACTPLVSFGTDDQKKRYLPGLCNGDLIAGNAMSEPDAGSDAYSLRTSAAKSGDHYVLNGSKCFVTNGSIADLIVVFATIDRSLGPRGVTAFLVDKEMSGLTSGPKLEKMGLRTSPMCEVFFQNCKVPASNRLGKEGAGSSLFSHSMTWERRCILASAVGSMQRLLEATIRYARTRKQFGQPIGKFQLVATRIVDMKLRLETARQMLYHGAWLRHQGRSAVMEASMAKLHISDSWVRCCEDAIQVHGGYGYLADYEVERELRDAIGSRLYSGTSEIQRTIIAGLLGL